MSQTQRMKMWKAIILHQKTKGAPSIWMKAIRVSTAARKEKNKRVWRESQRAYRKNQRAHQRGRKRTDTWTSLTEVAVEGAVDVHIACGS